MTWQPGRDQIKRLLDNGELERVTPDTNLARRMLADAGDAITTATKARDAATTILDTNLLTPW